MNITDSHSTAAYRLASPLALGRLERMFGTLNALLHKRDTRRGTPTEPERPVQTKPTRSEVWRQMQREKWLGKPPVGAAAPASPRPKDLHRRVLQDPNA